VPPAHVCILDSIHEAFSGVLWLLGLSPASFLRLLLGASLCASWCWWWGSSCGVFFPIGYEMEAFISGFPECILIIIVIKWQCIYFVSTHQDVNESYIFGTFLRTTKRDIVVLPINRVITSRLFFFSFWFVTIETMKGKGEIRKGRYKCI